ncbi:MAG TPA: methyltransferase domain-containing protein [Prolixibacteraceae bacterium]|nr:methyltransferase domain-containing protein [Prolixibacteraceae bacterium]
MSDYLKTDFDLDSDLLIEVFDELPIWASPFGLKLLDNIRYKKNISALDIGFGAGFPLTEIAMRLGNTCKVYGIDPWEAAIRRTEKKIEFYGIKNIELFHGVAERIPLPDHSVDLITSNNGLNNVENLELALSECSRVIKTGGQLIHTYNLEHSLFEFYDLLKEVLEADKMDAELKKMNGQIYKKRKPVNEFVKLLERNNFRVSTILHDKFDYKFADGTAMLNHYFMRLAFLDGWKSIIPVEKQVEIFKRIEILLNRKAEKNGYVKLSVPFVLLDCVRN